LIDWLKKINYVFSGSEKVTLFKRLSLVPGGL
jgi:hypothetical protein